MQLWTACCFAFLLYLLDLHRSHCIDEAQEVLEDRQHNVTDGRQANTESIVSLLIKGMKMGYIRSCLLYLNFIFLYFRFRKLVLIAIQDESSCHMNHIGYNALVKLGAYNPLKNKFRSSYARLVGLVRVKLML